ncbi:1-acyl-sn-glycerol-3-phosphate acyltransferase [Hoyosella rhizosphaerae]|uniref:1-acylglycerol-3-phosphate O-acyltransferase n=1 Tax=Hoyosella rhizosphaerae TaxID=1755582 RepID=A0A916U0Y2_9ACTN|nr:lysophospholipid acyltransferase family protein [Hoyosella rhizosphaerae]MBN4926999.1 1-acyl-sn-glycerol-3-phosphate acyltransferase [Hoyosella rhizosphaerae]GGC54834.1 putative 1-acylglycerol-3-phosphate O-acyltransferase [Hoyosella rhizosphaerae]
MADSDAVNQHPDFSSNQAFYWLLKFALIGPFMRVYNRPKVDGLENIPKEGPAVIAGNHLSIADWLFAPLASPRRISYLAKNEYFTTPGISGKLQRFFFVQTGQVPIDRTGASAAENALNTAKRLLREGRLVGLYPEGTRSPDSRLYKGKTGVARVALDTGVPIIPVGVTGTEKVCPPGKMTWGHHQVTVKFGKPINPAEFGESGDTKAERTLTDHIMKEIQALTGQEYVDEYAPRGKKNK